MATLENRYIDQTYKGLLNIDNSNAGIDGTLRTVQDGEGTESTLQLSTTGVKFTGTVAYGSYSVAFGGNFSTAAAFTTSGANALTLTTTASTNVTLPTTGTLATLAGSETLTNKTVNLTSNTLTGTIAQFNTALSDADFATLTGTETLTNKTITSPKIETSILDTNGNELFILTATSSAVNEVTYANAATGNSPSITASGDDSNISISLVSKGTGGVILKGTGTNDSASAGYIGEIIESEILVASAVSLTSGVAANVTSISLTAGDWDVWGNVITSPDGTTTTSAVSAGINTTSATLPTAPNKGAYSSYGSSLSAGNALSLVVGQRRLSINATTTVYLVINVSFATSTMDAYGYIGARRVR